MLVYIMLQRDDFAHGACDKKTRHGWRSTADDVCIRNAELRHPSCSMGRHVGNHSWLLESNRRGTVASVGGLEDLCLATRKLVMGGQ